MHFFPKKFYPHFSGNPANVLGNDIFPVQKTLQKMMKIMNCEPLPIPFVYRDRDFGWRQNYCKKHTKCIQILLKMGI